MYIFQSNIQKISLEFVYNFLHQLRNSVSIFATDLDIDSLSFLCYFGQIRVYLLIVIFVADYVNGTGTVVVLDFSEPIIHAVDCTFV